MTNSARYLSPHIQRALVGKLYSAVKKSLIRSSFSIWHFIYLTPSIPFYLHGKFDFRRPFLLPTPDLVSLLRRRAGLFILFLALLSLKGKWHCSCYKKRILHLKLWRMLFWQGTSKRQEVFEEGDGVWLQFSFFGSRSPGSCSQRLQSFLCQQSGSWCNRKWYLLWRERPQQSP